MILPLIVTFGVIVLSLTIYYLGETSTKTVVTFRSRKGILITAKILANATRVIKIRGGEMTAEFCSNPQIINSFEKILSQRSVKIKILFGPQIDVRNHEFLRLLVSNLNKVEVRWMPERKMPHFIVVDERFLSLEDEHEMLTERRGIAGKTTTAIIFSDYFDRLWKRADTMFDLVKAIKQASPISKEEIGEPVFGFITREKEEICPADKISIKKLQAQVFG